MRTVQAVRFGLVGSVCATLVACASTPSSGFGLAEGDDGGAGAATSSGGGSSSGSETGSSGSATGSSGAGASSSGVAATGGIFGSSGGPKRDAGTGSGTTQTIIYAHTDDTLYTLDPMTMTATEVGAFSGLGGGKGDTSVTDLAVNGNGDVYVNSETVLYQAALPSGGTGTVNLTQVATLAGGGDFYALAFAPVGALDANSETLVGGDSNGMLWAIDPAGGSAFELGNFGADPGASGNTLGLSGDIVFYVDASNNPTAIATIRSCSNSTHKCGNDYLAGIDMNAIKTAYTNKSAAASLLSGVYGSPGAGQLGEGTGFYGVYGLGAWDSTVFGFSRYNKDQMPQLITIDTTTGAGTATSQSFSFQNGWSGAGVTTKVTVTVRPPPMVN